MYVVLFLHHSVYYSEETQWHFCSRTVNGEVKKKCAVLNANRVLFSCSLYSYQSVTCWDIHHLLYCWHDTYNLSYCLALNIPEPEWKCHTDRGVEFSFWNI